MKSVALFVSFFFMTCLPAATQGRGWPQPPEPADKGTIVPRRAEAQPNPRLDALQLQREARELSDLANTLPVDVNQVTHGVLPKDLIEKLKRIEKLAKHIRGEIVR